MKKRDVVFEMIQDFFVCIVLSTVAALVSGGIPGAGALLGDIAFAWVVNVIIGLVIPEKAIGMKLNQLLKVPEKAGFYVVLAVIVVINVFGISACAVLRKTGFQPVFFMAWRGLLLPLLIAGYAAGLLFFPLSGRLTDKICGTERR